VNKLIVGLTGGIGSGKSTVAKLFVGHGCEIIDTDAIAHQLTTLGQAALSEIISAFGRSILQSDGTLNRPLLRQKAFADASTKTTLENILHPRIREVVTAGLVKESKAPYRMIVVPLLVETGAYDAIVNRILVVDCPENVQIQRVLARNALNEAEIHAIMAAQCSREQRNARADDIIVNDTAHGNLVKSVNNLHEKYIALA
jgi:dephospho-CoA kinase